MASWHATFLLLLFGVLLNPCNLHAQIIIGGNVYGGGNKGDVDGSTNVTVYGGDIDRVFGGARMANVGGKSFVHLDGEHGVSPAYTIINYVFGGNDISGTVYGSGTLPSELTQAAANGVDDSWTSILRFTTKLDGSGDPDPNNKIYVGQMFGGGNGDYTYPDTPNLEGKYEVLDGATVLGTSDDEFQKPELAKAYLEILGGSIVYGFGGGNSATVTENTVICVDNPSEVVSSIKDLNNRNCDPDDEGELLTTERTTTGMALNAVTTYATSDAFQIGSLFGGNNKATMTIRPKWKLKSGKVRNIYSGGNEGNMTHSEGLLVEILDGSTIIVDNLYGGCRKSDVFPRNSDGSEVASNNVQLSAPGYYFPAGYSARVLVRGGDVNNVYGGNDITGHIHGGSAVGIYSSIRGNVFGGGNGSYAYTDNSDLKDDQTWGDFYYDVNSILGKSEDYVFSSQESAEALNQFRPHGEAVSLRVHGRSALNPTIIGGALYVGGNSASLRDIHDAGAFAELKIGSHVIADNVFLGNNGVNMVDASVGGILERYAGNVTIDEVSHDFSQMDLTNSSTFAEYMDGCAMSVKPKVVFDNMEKGDPENYEDYTTSFGSFFCGGNVGSMTFPGKTTIDFTGKVIIFNKFVGGCNNANVTAGTYNAAFNGGVLASGAGMVNLDGSINDCLELNLSGVRIQPKRWLDPDHKEWGLEWNTFDKRTNADVNVMPSIVGTSTDDDLNRRLRDGNVYGGCYNSGHINGNVIINLNDNIIDKDRVFDIVEPHGESLYGTNEYNILSRNSGVILDEQGMDPFGMALNVFGGGYGADAEVWGSTTVNLKKGYTFQIFGGGEQGAIGKKDISGNYSYNEHYSTHVNMHNPDVAGSDVPSAEMAETEFIYGGSFEAPIAGNTIVHLDNGRIFNSFAGSCNADIEGHTETYVGLNGFPYVIDHIYGGNDLGGSIKGEADFSGRVREAIRSSVYNPTTTTRASAYIEYQKGHIVNIFGGAYGVYDYEVEYDGYTPPRLSNAFINFCPVSSSNPLNGVAEIYGAGEGQSLVVDRDVMQERSYIHIDIPQNITTFQTTSVFGAGAFSGLGMGKTPIEAAAAPNTVSAVIDLFRGQIGNVYGGSYQEGVTRRTVVNVPAGSTIFANSIFGGAYGLNNVHPCDVYESHVNYSSSLAQVSGGIFGGNNHARRTLYANVDINATYWSNQAAGWQGEVYGAGRGEESWAQYTNVNINSGGLVYKAFGGGDAGQVLNLASVNKKKEQVEADYAAWETAHAAWVAGGKVGDEPAEPALSGIDLTIGTGYTDNGLENSLAAYGALVNDVVDEGITRDWFHEEGGTKEKYNTNVHVNSGGTVTGYAYGGGKGETAVVSGTTYGDVLGGTVDRDFYAGGQGGSVMNLYYNSDPLSPNHFLATANLYIKGGSVRNAYGGGYLGSVGYHDTSTSSTATDVLAESNVVIGATPASATYANGVPTILRNAYGSGEGGSIYGTAHITLNNGYVGYRYEGGSYVEELDDPGLGEDASKDAIIGAGNVFGGGYIANSYADSTVVRMYDGRVRGCLYGGGEVGPVGRGTLKNPSTGERMDMPTIDKGGATQVELYGGLVERNVFGGGRGLDSWGGDGTKFMTDAQKEASDFYTKGFVFGSTRVNIHGGIVGTTDGVEDGYGNVFGGGDLGYVYSATGRKIGSHPNVLSPDNGLPSDGGGYYYIDGPGGDAADIANGMSLDCSVDVAPYCKVINAGGITIGSTTYSQGDLVPTEDLNKIANRNLASAEWAKLDLSGVIIRNAVFAGGNVSEGSDLIFVNTKTVYGNATASLRDVYHMDLITIGTEHTGGLYGDGNLTFVDGFRELHIANYGTDFYGLSDKIDIETYHSLTDRERAYFELQYQCQQHCEDKNGKSYEKNALVSADDYKELFESTIYYNNEAYWKEYGFCSVYAGRLLNTIQRADFVGVYGSRMVLQGALDRVPEKADHNQYTINRVDEISLNQQRSAIVGDVDPNHGNYFGIYSKVNYLGNLTSDVKFDAVRTTDVPVGSANEADGKTYYEWKEANAGKSNRNNATSQNKVALNSGVFLELTREEGEKLGETVWGYITGVIELDLINVMQGEGGGYVYAKNEHGVKHWHGEGNSEGLPVWDKVTLSPYNLTARTYKRFTYETSDATKKVIETSGNFVHNEKQIVDDCFPRHDSYKGVGASPAHYWYIKGSIYVYDQYISAYTGSATAYSETVSIPLTISAHSHGKLQLREIKPNLYAYYDEDGKRLGDPTAQKTFIAANGITYSLNDPINWWEWHQLSSVEQSRFVAETYTTIAECKIGSTTYPKGYTMLKTEYDALLLSSGGTVYNTQQEEDQPFTNVFRPTNNIAHGTGYALTYDITNPMVWDNWYTDNSDLSQAERINTEDYSTLSVAEKAGYTEGPTYYLNAATSGVYGQKDYKVEDIIDKHIYDTYDAIPDEKLPGGQATFAPAWIVTSELKIKDKDNNEHHLYPGVAIVESDYPADQWTAITSKRTEAYVVTSTKQLDDSHYLYAGDLMSAADISQAYSDYSLPANALDEYVARAYYCTVAGKYGGKLFETGKPYSTIEAWCSLSAEDREDFTFNYDALDVLIDPTYSGSAGHKYTYDGTNDPKIYSVKKSVDYQALYTGTSNLTYLDEDGASVTIEPDQIISREQYEDIPNEKYHYAPITVTAPGHYYIVNTSFVRGDIPYTVGQVITSDLYGSLNSDQQDCVDDINFTSTYTNAPDLEGNYEPKTYYYCRDSYAVNENGEGVSVTTMGLGNTTQSTYTASQTVPVGFIISESNYEDLPNKTVVVSGGGDSEYVFSILGNTPVETSTLYVSRESDIFDLSKEKIITVAYLYEYEESDESGLHITPVSERHIVNIHIDFKSGVPEIGLLSKPATVLPSNTVGMKVPSITPGAYEILGSGWEFFTNESDAISHKNGQPYVNNTTPMYWYQDGYWVAYYAKTYLGKTYSNAVQFSVANYHDLDAVMKDTEHHMYVDHEDVRRDPKIYIDNRDCVSDPDKNELDLLKDFFDLSLQTRTYDGDDNPEAISGTGTWMDGHVGVNTTQIGGSKNLEFFLRSDMSPKAYSPTAETPSTWTPIGTDDSHCFDGTLHGDGYTISGLDHSLFKNLCGNVYNLGVTGSFTGAGIVDEGAGYVENCWVMSSASPVADDVKAVFGDPTAADGQQVVNCYYPATNAYDETASPRGNARKMPLSSFYNGEVAYDLNGFYLNKRYADQELSSGTEYGFYRANADGTLTAETSYYSGSYAIYPLKSLSPQYGYVENRFADGDFIYAGGSIPEERDARYYDSGGTYYPIWPDDYLFFGQMLTYGYVTGRDHQDTPAHINRDNSRLATASASVNRVYRAPAYFRSKTMGVAHYNPYAVFASTKKDDVGVLAYKDMTAIDFTGGNDVFNVANGESKPYELGLQAGKFFPPLLDNDGLEDLRNADLTKNWLVYAPAATLEPADADSKTNAVVLEYLPDLAYSETNAAYHTVARADDSEIHGHAVVKQPAGYKALNDHFLVDKQDFNAPLAYTFDSEKRMWYQRMPDLYAGQKTEAGVTSYDSGAGWESVSLPFTADIVTTHQKGELTHFYQDNVKGHEYWLREYKDITGVTGDDERLEALFTYPAKQADHDKEYTNTFLWDYYYSESTSKDKNEDIYKEYYSDSHTYEDYPSQQRGTPYLIGFPGKRYYEFDLSGAFEPLNTYSDDIAVLDPQTITFASATGYAVGVSDDELTDVTYNGYNFKPTYMSESIAAGTDTYLLSADGDSYDKVPATGDPIEVLPFRPYFTAVGGGGVKGFKGNARRIVFSNEYSEMFGEEEEEEDDISHRGELIIVGRNGKIVVSSTYQVAKEVRIYSVGGAIIDNYTIQPGETVETAIHTSGVYLVNKKKLSVKIM